MSVYVKALRAPFLSGSVVPVVLGSAMAFMEHRFSAYLFLITLLGVAALHLGANLINDYHDSKGSDPINTRLTPFSGGSRVIQKGEIPARKIYFLACLFFAIGAVAGIWLATLGRPLVLLIGAMGLAAGWAYSSPPLQLMSRGWGELVIFFAFGPLITLGTYYVMTGSLSWTAFALGFPQGFLIAAVIWINQFPDYQADSQAGKKNLVVRLGPGSSRFIYGGIMMAAFVMILFLISVAGLPYLIMLSFAALPLAVRAIRILFREYLSHEGVIPAQALTIQSMIAHGLLLSLGLVLGRMFGI